MRLSKCILLNAWMMNLANTSCPSLLAQGQPAFSIAVIVIVILTHKYVHVYILYSLYVVRTLYLLVRKVIKFEHYYCKKTKKNYRQLTTPDCRLYRSKVLCNDRMTSQV